MIGTLSLGNNVSAVLAMARGEDNWMDGFDVSVDGVFRSLLALPLSLPLILLSMEAVRQSALGGGAAGGLLALSPVGFLLTKVVIAYLTWAGAMTVVLILAAKGAEPWRAAPVIVAQNWSTFLAYCSLAPLILLVSVEGASALGPSGPVTGLYLTGVALFSIWLDWGVLRRPLGLGIGPAIALILVLQMVAMLINDSFARIVMMATGQTL